MIGISNVNMVKSNYGEKFNFKECDNWLNHKIPEWKVREKYV